MDFFRDHQSAIMAVMGCAYAVLEYWLPRTEKVKARSVIEGCMNILGALIPVAHQLGTPETPPSLEPVPSDQESTDPQRKLP